MYPHDQKNKHILKWDLKGLSQVILGWFVGMAKITKQPGILDSQLQKNQPRAVTTRPQGTCWLNQKQSFSKQTTQKTQPIKIKPSFLVFSLVFL
jgi:hypothetical protein